jgi:hypothetical protein
MTDPEAYPGLPAEFTTEQKRHYRMGWAAGGRDDAEGLDGHETKYLRKYGDGPLYTPWMDGYMDRATGREFAHIPNCPDHASASCELDETNKETA